MSTIHYQCIFQIFHCLAIIIITITMYYPAGFSNSEDDYVDKDGVMVIKERRK